MGRRRLSNQPIRLAAGAFMVYAGTDKLHADENRSAAVHGMAKGSFPFFANIAPEQFVKALAVSEVAIGAALLLPLVPDHLAGLALAPFAGGLMYMYSQTDAMHEPGSLRPSQMGTGVAKDVWLLGIALTLLATRGRRSKADHRA